MKLKTGQSEAPPRRGSCSSSCGFGRGGFGRGRHRPEAHAHWPGGSSCGGSSALRWSASARGCGGLTAASGRPRPPTPGRTRRSPPAARRRRRRRRRARSRIGELRVKGGRAGSERVHGADRRAPACTVQQRPVSTARTVALAVRVTHRTNGSREGGIGRAGGQVIPLGRVGAGWPASGESGAPSGPSPNQSQLSLPGERRGEERGRGLSACLGADGAMRTAYWQILNRACIGTIPSRAGSHDWTTVCTDQCI